MAFSSQPSVTNSLSVRREPLVLAALVTVWVMIAALVGLDTGQSGIQLFTLGTLLGVVFLAFAFGFASGWRLLLTTGNSMPMAAHFLLAALLAGIFIPATALQLGAQGAAAPLSWSLLIGAFVFGIGAQLANGCGSGVLFSFGGGSGRMLVALPAFVIGSVIGSMILPAALDWGQLSPILIGSELGVFGQTAVNIALLGGVAWLCWWQGRRRGFGFPRKLGIAVGIIALLCALVFALAGHPWGITFGFTLWGAKLAQAGGIDMTSFAFWQWPGPARALEHSVLADTSSLMNIGMVIGATAWAALGGGLRKQEWPNQRQLFAAALGGITMGIGARLAFGCNIGAFLGGTASGSLHGWIWFAMALAGSWVGIRLRPRFGF